MMVPSVRPVRGVGSMKMTEPLLSGFEHGGSQLNLLVLAVMAGDVEIFRLPPDERI